MTPPTHQPRTQPPQAIARLHTDRTPGPTRPAVFYSDAYFVDIGGDAHVFPMEKFPLVPRLLVERGLLTPFEWIDPGLASSADLRLVHTAEWLAMVQSCSVPEPLRRRLGLPMVPGLYDRSRAEVAGTIAAARAALDSGLSLNLAGGTHHAFADRGEGFCVFNDVAVAIHTLRRDRPDLHVMVVDLDAHQGNGTNALFGHDPLTFTYSVHVAENYPSKKVAGSMDIGLRRFATPAEWWDAVLSSLPQAVERFEPDLVFYIAGVDPHRDDRFGQLQLSTEDLKDRDNFILRLLGGWWIPTTVLYGGGYHKLRRMTAELHAQTAEVVINFHKSCAMA